MVFSVSYSQIDSVRVGYEFTTESDSLSTYDVLLVTTYIDGIDYVGKVSLTLYTKEGFPLQKQVYTIEEYELNGGSSGDSVANKFIVSDNESSYKLITRVQQYNKANYPSIETIINE